MIGIAVGLSESSVVFFFEAQGYFNTPVDDVPKKQEPPQSH